MLDILSARAGGADRFVVVDTETTGVYPSDRIVELAIVTVSLDGKILEVFDTLINPCRDVSCSHIHGITASMVRDAPTFDEVAGDVAVRLHGACFVAHNLPFDRRMLVNEFDKLGEQLVVVNGIDTYEASGCRLPEACSQFGISLAGQHRALADAMAAAELFRLLADRCRTGSPIAAPIRLRPAGKVLCREHTAPVQLPEAPLITYLASRLPVHGLAVRSQEYLELVGRAVADLHLDRDERDELRTFAAELGLTDAEVAQAHRRYVNELTDAAIEDEVVTDEEYDMLVRVAAALDVDQDAVERRIRRYRVAETESVLQPGMEVVFTGGHPSYSREELQQLAADRGLVPAGNVTRNTSVVFAADPETNSGKAAKARRYGIPIVSIDEFLNSRPGDAVTGAGQATLKVVTCPDCLVTWTVPANSGSHSRRRCDDCSRVTPSTLRDPAAAAPAAGGWAPPSIEWLSCRHCLKMWPRQVGKGRKPHRCPDCSGQALPPPPVGHTSAGRPPPPAG